MIDDEHKPNVHKYMAIVYICKNTLGGWTPNIRYIDIDSQFMEITMLVFYFNIKTNVILYN